MLNSVTWALLVLLDCLSYASLVLSIFMVVIILFYVCLLIALQLSLIYHFPRYEAHHFLRTEARIYMGIVDCLGSVMGKFYSVRPSSTDTIAYNTDQAKGSTNRPALNNYRFLQLRLVPTVPGPLNKEVLRLKNVQLGMKFYNLEIIHKDHIFVKTKQLIPKMYSDYLASRERLT